MTKTPGARAWQMAVTAAAVFAVDPPALSIRLRARAGPVRDRWLEIARALTPERTWRILPPGIGDDRLLGGLDLAATLRAGKPVVRRGLLAEVDGGILLMTMTERSPADLVARVTAAADQGTVIVERDGLRERAQSVFGIVAFDEGAEPEERPTSVLTDRLAVWLDLTAVCLGDMRVGLPYEAAAIARAQRAYAGIRCDEDLTAMLCRTAAALGIDSLRAPLAAVRVARAAAALRGAAAVEDDDVHVAAALVLGPRALHAPMDSEAPEISSQSGNADEAREASPDDAHDTADAADAVPEQAVADEGIGREEALSRDEQLIEAARAALPAHLLEDSRRISPVRHSSPARGRSGAEVRGRGRGRAVGAQPGPLRDGARLDVLATLRAAAPWQRLRRDEHEGATESKVIVRPEDFRITRLVHRTETTTIFVVDASGSAALHRMAEAKGAVELMLSEAYVRRDEVALVAFADRGARILLPPTRSLVRARRCLAGLPAGGATPLASGLQAAATLADGIRRKAAAPTLVVLSDGRPNIALDGEPGRRQAVADALGVARTIKAARIAALWIDTGKWPDDRAKEIAAAMDARWLSLPRMDAQSISRAVRGVA
jgi:magnesium chelatase subunit D